MTEQERIDLLDRFAGQALAGYLAAHADTEVLLPKEDEAAETAYSYAEAMLAEREKRLAGPSLDDIRNAL